MNQHLAAGRKNEGIKMQVLHHYVKYVEMGSKFAVPL